MQPDLRAGSRGGDSFGVRDALHRVALHRAPTPRSHWSQFSSAAARHRRNAARAPLGDRHLNRADDSHIAGAAAEIAAHGDSNLLLVRVGQPHDEIARRDEHPRCAIAALQRVLARECCAQFAGNLVIIEAFDRGYIGALAGERVGDAGARRNAIDEHRAGAANAMLAAEMRPGEVQLLANEIGEMGARLDRASDLLAVHRQRDFAHCSACAAARRKVTT